LRGEYPSVYEGLAKKLISVIMRGALPLTGVASPAYYPHTRSLEERTMATRWTWQRGWAAAWRLGLVAVLVCYSQTFAYGSILNSDVTIDANNSFPNEHVTITDGPGGPAHVTMEGGGIVRGFTVAGNSTFEILGGGSIRGGGTRDNASLVVRGGVICCSALPECLVLDSVSLLGIGGNSTLHVFGGQVNGLVSIGDNAVVHFYGRNLTLSLMPGGASIMGELANGDSAGGFGITTIDPFVELSTQIVLHEIPEPATTVLLVFSLVSFTSIVRTRKPLA
jgi:hypothetical protein